MMPPPWPRRTWGWPWGPGGQPPPPRPPTWSSWWTGSTGLSKRSASPNARAALPPRAGSPGLGLSSVAMAFAAAGFLPPVMGALLQEAIDVAVILNALRALGGGRDSHARTLAPELGDRFRAEHHRLAPSVARLRRVADVIDTLPPAAARAALEEVEAELHELVLHEGEDDAQLYPAVARRLGGTGPTATMSRAHQEIRR